MSKTPRIDQRLAQAKAAAENEENPIGRAHLAYEMLRASKLFPEVAQELERKIREKEQKTSKKKRRPKGGK